LPAIAETFNVEELSKSQTNKNMLMEKHSQWSV